VTARQATNPQAGLPTAGASIGAAPGQTRTVTAEELGYELVNRCLVTFTPAGEGMPLRGRLVELVQPPPDSGHRPPGLEKPTTLYVALDGTKDVVPFPVPTTTAVTVTVDPA
jgi:hypothetical protein